MDRLYSLSLVVAIAAGLFSLAVGLVKTLKVGAAERLARPPWRNLLSCRVTAAAIALGALSLALSIAVHAQWGHGPAAAQPLNFQRLISEHESFTVAAIILLLGLAVTLPGFFSVKRP